MKMINKKINRFFICLFNLIMRTNLIKDFFLQQHNYNRCHSADDPKKNVANYNKLETSHLIV